MTRKRKVYTINYVEDGLPILHGICSSKKEADKLKAEFHNLLGCAPDGKWLVAPVELNKKYW
jgi:hypothetical protein